jgi:hypothetical protein
MIREDMMERMSAEEFAGWMAYAQIEPFGEPRADLRAGLQWITGINMWLGKGRKPLRLEDYPLLQSMRPREPVTSTSVFAALKALAEATSRTKPS